MLKFLLTLIFLIKLCNGLEKFLEVETSLGKVKGLQMPSRLGNSFWAFRGIHYAEPPVGELRFQNPSPVREWKPLVFDATKDGPRCPQAAANRTDLSEDCLRLNVYTKDVSGSKPVIVYIHPGGFYALSATTPYAGAENFMDRDIVLVTVNYRLGSLGFMATGTADAPGNMGLKDQVLALHWVQEHIKKFGGNPNSITLWGYSAGSASIGLHMMSPMSRGLFHRAIMMSSSPLGGFRYRNNQSDLAEKQARLLNCPEKPIRNMIKCLKTKPMIDFVNTTAAMFEFNWNPILNWEPVVEPDCGQERFLTEDPYKSMLSGNIYKVPLIIGTNQFEFYSSAYYTLRNATSRQRFNEDFNKYSPIYFKYERNTNKSRTISSAIRSFYFQNQPLEYPQSLDAFARLYSDSITAFKYNRFLQLVQKHVPVWTYFFTYKGRYSFFRNPETNQTHGAVHHDELLYLLHYSSRAPLFKKSDPENDLVERFTRMWASFAENGNPINAQDEYLKNIQWPLYTPNKKEYLEINSDLKLKSGGFYTERLQFWDDLFPPQEMINTKLSNRCGQ